MSRRLGRKPLLAVVGIVAVLVVGVLAAVTLNKGGGTPSASSAAAAAAARPVITTDDSKAHCIALNFKYTYTATSNNSQTDAANIAAASQVSGQTYNCITLFDNPVDNWDDWETPWMFSTASDGWVTWLKNAQHQLVVGVDLIPQSAGGVDNPLAWESACSAGDYNQYATTLAKNLVSYGAGSIVIRLGIEANQTGETDFVGTTPQEMSDWAKCYDNEVTAMRAVPGTHFLFVWNPNACTQSLPLNDWYPGNAYVDIIGLDLYDEDCATGSKTVSKEGWTAFASDSSSGGQGDPNFPSLDSMLAFAKAHGKPMSFPEWGIDSGDPDDATYVTDMMQVFKKDNFAFESYFDNGNDGIATLGPDIPQATAAYVAAFK
ncbi:MAG TPA: glycosyl hydrolase [Trebonia sp.]|nr:glycosyl hydrolase [Trebonia sp.]